LSGETIPGFFRQHLIGTRIAKPGDDLGPFVQLFQRYQREWLELAERGYEYGWPWAERLAARPLVAVA
jgi:hypothetical protein